MQIPTTRPRYGAIALGALCAVGAAGILLEDVRHTHTITVEHALAVLVLVATIGAGHMAIGEARTSWRRWPHAALLAVLALAGTFYCVKSTAGRVAEAQRVKVASADASNTTRTLLEQDLAIARTAVADAGDKVAKYCRREHSGNCQVWTRREAAYRAQVELTIGKLGKLEPAAAGDTGLRWTSALLASITGYAETAIRTRLGLLDPLLPALILELGSILFLGLGFPHAGTVRPDRPAERPAPSDALGQSDYPALGEFEARKLVALVRPDRDDEGGLSLERQPRPRDPAPDGPKDRVLARLLTDLGTGRTFPSQQDLCRTYGVARSSMSDWLAEWEAAGMIPERRTVGRRKALGTAGRRPALASA